MNRNILKSGQAMLDDKPDFKLIARDTELNQMINILGRRFAHNVLLTGQGGAGCSLFASAYKKQKKTQIPLLIF